MATHQTLDRNQFEILASLQEEGQPDVLVEMANLFVHDVGQYLVEARDAASAADTSALRRIAHNLKGVCGTLGADRMRALATDLEVALTAGSALDTASHIHGLDEEFAQVTTLLTRYLDERRGISE